MQSSLCISLTLGDSDLCALWGSLIELVGRGTPPSIELAVVMLLLGAKVRQVNLG